MNTRPLVYALILVLSFFIPHTLHSQNPICPPGVYIPDPTSRVIGGKLFIYGSLDEKRGIYCSDHYHVLSSANLRDWTLHRDSFRGEGGMYLYAPDMICKDGTYYLYYDNPSGEEFVATSGSPTGPFTDGVKIEGPSGIDPAVFIDDDGQAYYFWGQFSAKGAKMNPDMKSIDPSTIVDGIVTEKEHYFHEGSYLVKRGKYYYFVYADISRRGRPTSIGYAMATSPLGPYEYKGVIVDNSGCDPEVWNNHGSIVQFGEQWYVLYHRSSWGSRTMRKACIERISFRDDGTIVEAEMTSQGASGPLDARDNLEGWRACLLNGKAYIRLEEGTTDHEILSNISPGDLAAFKYLDFGRKSPSKVTVRAKSREGGTLSVIPDQSFYGGVARVDIPAGEGEWKEYTAPLTKEVTGVHAIWVGFGGPGSGKGNGNEEEGLFDIDWIRFE